MKNIVVCADLNQDSLNTLKKLRSILDLDSAILHFIHVFEIHIYNSEVVPVVYPSEDQYAEIEESITKILQQLSSDLAIPADRVRHRCYIAHSKESKITSYLQDVKADMVVVATRGKHGIEGFFSSSLTDYLSKYSPCDVLVLRPQK